MSRQVRRQRQCFGRFIIGLPLYTFVFPLCKCFHDFDGIQLVHTMPDDHNRSADARCSPGNLEVHPELRERTHQKDGDSSDGNGTRTNDPSRGEGDR